MTVPRPLWALGTVFAVVLGACGPETSRTCTEAATTSFTYATDGLSVDDTEAVKKALALVGEGLHASLTHVDSCPPDSAGTCVTYKYTDPRLPFVGLRSGNVIWLNSSYLPDDASVVRTAAHEVLHFVFDDAHATAPIHDTDPQGIMATRIVSDPFVGLTAHDVAYLCGSHGW